MNEPKELTGAHAELANLYFDSKTVKFGAFKLAAHEANPDLELSPIYLHYPKPGEEGADLLPRIYDIAGQLFFDLAKEKGINFDKIGAVPKGAQPLALEMAKHYPDYPGNLLEFGKEEVDGKRIFVGPTNGEFKKGDVMVVVEDHTSGGYNKSLFKGAVEKTGLVIHDVLTVVDRQQGAAKYLSSHSIGFHSIFGIDRLLAHYLATDRIDQERADTALDYIRRNQIAVKDE